MLAPVLLATNRYEQKISVEISVLHDKKGTYNHSLYTFISNTCSLYRVPKNSKWRLICYLTLLLVPMIESSRLYQLKQDSFSLNLEIGTHMALLKFFHRFSASCSLFAYNSEVDFFCASLFYYRIKRKPPVRLVTVISNRRSPTDTLVEFECCPTDAIQNIFC